MHTLSMSYMSWYFGFDPGFKQIVKTSPIRGPFS